MIAIYDKTQISLVQKWVGKGTETDRPNLNIYCDGYILGKYETVEQRDYVIDQIATAIERKDTLYRMPSVEEVELEVQPGNCRDCKVWNKSNWYCFVINDCTRLQAKCCNWQPIEPKE